MITATLPSTDIVVLPTLDDLCKDSLYQVHIVRDGIDSPGPVMRPTEILPFLFAFNLHSARALAFAVRLPISTSG